MKKRTWYLVIAAMLVLTAAWFTSCADDPSIDNGYSAFSGSLIHIDIVQKTKDTYSTVNVPALWAKFLLTGPTGETQLSTWKTNDPFYLEFRTTRYGVHKLDVTDVDTMFHTNTNSGVLNIQQGYNYTISISLGDVIVITNITSNTNTPVVTNTNTNAAQPLGAFGLWSEITPISVHWDNDTRMDIWHDWSANLSVDIVHDDVGYGSQSWKFTGTGSWMGLGIRVDSLTNYTDMRAYTNGSLNFLFKGSKPFKVGIKDKTKARWVTMSQMWHYGFAAGNPTNNTWVKVSIPMSAFRAIGIDLSQIEQYFMFLADSTTRYTIGSVFYFDELYWSKTAECSNYTDTPYTPGTGDANVAGPRIVYDDLDFKTDYAYIGKADSGSTYVYGVLKVNYTGMETISYVKFNVNYRKADGTLLDTDWSYVKNTNVINNGQPDWNCDTFLSPADNKGFFFIIKSISGFTVQDIALLDVTTSYDALDAFPAVGRLSVSGFPYRGTDYGGDNWYLNLKNTSSADINWSDIRFVYKDQLNRRFKWGFGLSTNILYVTNFYYMPAGSQMLFYDAFMTPDYSPVKFDFSDALLDWDPYTVTRSLVGGGPDVSAIRQIQNDPQLSADEKNLQIKKQLDLNIQNSR